MSGDGAEFHNSGGDTSTEYSTHPEGADTVHNATIMESPTSIGSVEMPQVQIFVVLIHLGFLLEILEFCLRVKKRKCYTKVLPDQYGKLIARLPLESIFVFRKSKVPLIFYKIT
jgi:hypothetical protein